MRISKRFFALLYSLTVSACLIAYGITMAAEAPEASTSIATICTGSVGAIIAGAWKYMAAESEAPSRPRSS